MTRLLTLAFLGGLLAVPAGTAQGPASAAPELKVLEHYVGSWYTEILSKGLPFTKGPALARWILDGQFIEQTGELQDANGTAVFKVKTIMTFDPAKKVYRTWTFASDGTMSDSEGTWNANTRVMTFSRKRDDGITTTITADFSTADVETWQIVSKDAGGKVITEIRGKNTRQKK